MLGESSLMVALPVGPESGVDAVCEDRSTIATESSAGTRLFGAAHLNPGIVFAVVRQPSAATVIVPNANAQNKEERIILSLASSIFE